MLAPVNQAGLLSVADYERVFAVLERVQDSSTVPEFKAGVLEALGSVFGLKHTTCFTGPTYHALFDDPDPLLFGRAVLAYRGYREGWDAHDIFRLPQARAILERDAAISARQLTSIPEGGKSMCGSFWVGVASKALIPST